MKVTKSQYYFCSNVHEKLKLFTYEVYYNIQHIKLDKSNAEAIHTSVVSLIIYHEAIGIDFTFKNNSNYLL